MTQEQVEIANDLISHFGSKAENVCDVIIGDLSSYRMKPYLTVQQATECAEHWVAIRNLIYAKTPGL